MATALVYQRFQAGAGFGILKDFLINTRDARFSVMDYTNQPVGNLLRGPLLNTPQGLVVCAAAIGYFLFALLVVLGIATPPLKLGVSGVVIGAVGYPNATANFDAFPRSVKRGILEWILIAKKAETRATRINETARLANQNLRANQWRDKRAP